MIFIIIAIIMTFTNAAVADNNDIISWIIIIVINTIFNIVIKISPYYFRY